MSEYSCDIVVVAAVKSGASVILIESYGFVGGLATEFMFKGHWQTAIDKIQQQQIFANES